MSEIMNVLEQLFMSTFTFSYSANVIWKACLSLVLAMFNMTPMDIGEGNVWNKLISNIYPLFSALGGSLLLTFLFVAFLKEISDFRKSITLELLVTYGVKIILGEFLLMNIITIVKEFFVIAATLSVTTFVDFQYGFVTPSEPQFSDFLGYFFWGIIYVVVALICGITIIFTVYKRFLNLYLLVIMAPIALSTITGDRGISQSAAAWVKAFLASTFEIVVTALALVISGWMISAGVIVFSALEGTLAGWTIGYLEGAMTMAITAATVKSSEGLLKRAYALV